MTKTFKEALREEHSSRRTLSQQDRSSAHSLRMRWGIRIPVYITENPPHFPLQFPPHCHSRALPFPPHCHSRPAAIPAPRRRQKHIKDNCFDILCPNLNHVVDYRMAGIRIFMPHADFDKGGVVGFPRLISRPLLPTLTVWRCFPRPISNPRARHASCELPYPAPPLALPAPPPPSIMSRGRGAMSETRKWFKHGQ